MCKQWMVRYMNLHDSYLTRAIGGLSLACFSVSMKPAEVVDELGFNTTGGERIV